MEESGCRLLSIKERELFILRVQLEVGGHREILQTHYWPPLLKKKKKKVAGRSNCSGSSKSFISAAINGFLHVSHLLRRTPGLLQTPVSAFQCKIPIVSAHTYTYVSIPLFYSVLRANTHFSEHVITQRRLQTRRRSSFRLHQSQLHSAAGEKIIGLICILQENQDIEENKKQTK